MTKNIYSLLVGINTYDPASRPFVSPLEGCVNDINAMEAYLQERIANDKNSDFKVQALKLTNEKATRRAIIDGFKNHLSQADSEDVVLFYYSGHGAYEPAPKEFWQEEPDHLNETLVCYDSRTPNSRDLADKELGYLISKVAKNNPHIVVILDCCHSGTGTRDILQRSRVAPKETRDRPWESFVFAEELRSRGGSQQVSIPQGKHIFLAACRDYQKAKEKKFDSGEDRGVFSYFLLQTLQHANGSLNYRDLVRNINALVSGNIDNQSPQVEAILSPELLEQSFLGGAVPERPPYFTLSYNEQERSWVIDGGALHGIPQSSGGEETILAIFAPDTSAEELSNLDGSLGSAKVRQVLPQLSLVNIEVGGDILNESVSYVAAVVSLPIDKLKVGIKGEDEGVKLAVAQLQTASGKGKPSLYVAQVEPEENADYYLEAKNGQYWIKLAMESDRPQVAPIPENLEDAGYTEERASVAIQRLEHIARWKNILELKSPAASRIKPGDVKLEIVRLREDRSEMPPTAAAEIALEYQRHYDSWKKPKFFVRLTNQSNQTLYCNVINLTQSYAVGLPFFTEKSSLRLQRGETIEGRIVTGSIPDNLWERGVTELEDRLKLIVSDRDFNASFLEQDKLDVTARSVAPSLSDPRLQNGLNRLLVRHQYKDIEVSPEDLANDWLTKEVIFTTYRPQGALSVSDERTISLGYGVEVLPHRSLEAKASFTTVEETTRSIGAVLPSILQEQPGVVEPMRFSSNSRGVNRELSALELFDVVDYKAVTPEAPLKVRLETTLEPGERLLAVGFDGEFFLPLGRLAGTGGDTTEISLERLPQPTSSGRSLHGSIRIFFEKVISQELGLPFDRYPILAAASKDAEGKVTSEKDPEIVAAKVAAAEKILLYVHGILDNTKMMAGSGQRVMLEIEGEEKLLGDTYDLVLTFDYENLNTTIEENARLLGEKLKAAGLAPKHQKQLDIVAHSMGGLVCRWFIEKEGGDRVVQRLVMAGTPNAGSPWPTIQDWAFATLGFALNQVSSVFFPAEMVAKLLELAEEKERTLDQMRPNSDFLRELANASGSSVPYVVIAGDRSLVPGAIESGILERLADRLFAGTLDLAFFGQPNDLAVTVASIKAVEKEGVSVDTVACDHFSYFSSEAGLKALAKALEPSGKGRKVEDKLPVKDNKKWLIRGVLLVVVVAIAGLISWQFYQQQQKQLPQESVSLQQPYNAAIACCRPL